MDIITLPELEEAINYWRSLRPASGEERSLSPEVDALATLYAMMIFRHAKVMYLGEIEPPARQLIEAWQRRQS